MDVPRESHGSPVEVPWKVHGSPVERSWGFCGASIWEFQVPMVLSSCSQGTCIEPDMENLSSHGASELLPWSFHLRWDLCGTLEFLQSFRGFPMTSVGRTMTSVGRTMGPSRKHESLMEVPLKPPGNQAIPTEIP